MNALSIIEAATAEGLTVNLSPTGSLKAIGEQEAVNRWQPLLKQHKAEIINLLATGKPGRATEAARPIPHWCRTDCPGLETIPLPNEGETAGCVHPVTGTWRRLDRLTECPAIRKATRPTLPEWCNPRCEHFHRLDVPEIGAMQWCCFERDETKWRRDRIGTMTVCPITAGT